jgi:hypothetical protein
METIHPAMRKDEYTKPPEQDGANQALWSQKLHKRI